MDDSLPNSRYGVVPQSRKIISGAGLRGGGSLNKDLTLYVNFGAGQGTCVEGNDLRLSDARNCLAPYASKPEALEGVEETQRSWSPALIHHAISGWWVNSSFGKSFQKHVRTLEYVKKEVDNGPYLSKRPSPIKTINMYGQVTYTLQSEDVGKTLVFDSQTDRLDIVLTEDFGCLGDEIYFIAPTSFIEYWENSFYTEVAGMRYFPLRASGLIATFRAANSVVGVKKIREDLVGFANWIIFGDIPEEV